MLCIFAGILSIKNNKLNNILLLLIYIIIINFVLE